jgi:selenide,water dikinase
MALAVVGMPLEKLPLSVIRRILEGGQSVCAAAGIPVAGGHSIDTLEPIYGLVALGLVHPDKVKKNSGARDGDVLVLGKPLGIGVLSAALKKGALSPEGYRQMLAFTTRLNTPGETLADMPEVHAVTDVTGFGLAGHLLEMLRGSNLAAEVRFEAVPMIPEALHWAKQGIATGASDRNWNGYGADVQMPAGSPAWMQKLLSDPQTSGGLLVACDPQAEREVLRAFAERGFPEARTIGRLSAGAPRLKVI